MGAGDQALVLGAVGAVVYFFGWVLVAILRVLRTISHQLGRRNGDNR